MLGRAKPVSGRNFSVIIPNYNGSRFLTDCLRSLNHAIQKCPACQFETIIVDNASIDNSIILAKKFTSYSIPNTKYLILNTNLGFAAAVNRGILISKYEYIVVCNNDITLDSGWFRNINSATGSRPDPQIAAYFGLVLNQDGTKIESEGFKYFPFGKAVNIGNGLSFHKSYFLNHKSCLIWGAPASLIIYRRSVLNKVGLFDPDFFAYLEDIDLNLRFQKLKYQTLYIPKALSYHLGGATSAKMGNLRQVLSYRNWLYIIIKNFSFSQILNNFLPLVSEQLKLLSGLVKSTIIIYQIYALFYLPYLLLKTYFQILVKLIKFALY